MTDKLIYSGKAKQMWTTDDEDVLRVIYMDQATALNGKKKDKIVGKGRLNNKISSLIFEYLKKNGIKTHFVQKISETEELVKKVKIVPLEMVTRNVAAGHFSTRFGVKEGLIFESPVEEMYFKSDELDDPFINESQTHALKIATHEELNTMWEISRKVNRLLTDLFESIGLQLVDFKLEFGKTKEQEIILADEFSPDNCRLWDLKSKQHMDKDVYRRDLGSLTSVYKEVLERLQKKLGGPSND
ncbi:phosphoribosylaminoimidazole-succinocarboxamide synthase [Liquorilactobacillus sucicola DSM 21376 = JCM 15457]|uniref:Phosphoribosylaminoimidazole-succinocarboxamide synthase n=1 Tax=Liquorilactobacillus sucicola DSM 21376 = JCM 15457 TaxID=1423806 RepID=A0A023CTY7_9LACO|nr:phosphoribosylaminoimidazolesuccinocarboxamide synthase [Liquorilactobacillus sucicola]KRN05131.1 phosphoribosylaminoimidazole-succinocarboxamide synthetase [Liquorilactobacillus sucicola DSM 21376 = JCM 15457]GAJ25179.1 phosphoribosylaminoimidazole-succinocarboxamide synthase [Liquorilactobacillus sucicola DSM 21376 = JCM 15457]